MSNERELLDVISEIYDIAKRRKDFRKFVAKRKHKKWVQESYIILAQNLSNNGYWSVKKLNKCAAKLELEGYNYWRLFIGLNEFRKLCKSKNTSRTGSKGYDGFWQMIDRASKKFEKHQGIDKILSDQRKEVKFRNIKDANLLTLKPDANLKDFFNDLKTLKRKYIITNDMEFVKVIHSVTDLELTEKTAARYFSESDARF